ncbi:MAG TPA: cysteine desulfurase family protein [Balneolales bacterium]|nr:cysteine desulfurase family protein [Balneolales bacterium]
MAKRTIYLDHSATTPVDPRVVETMYPYFTDDFGNASSTHQLGRKANVAVEEAREKIAHYLGTEPKDIVFTSGGTESDNTAIKGALKATGKKHIVTSAIEHHAVLEPTESLTKMGYKANFISPDENGRISPEKVKKAITDDTGIISLMHVNNEIGIINPISEIAGVCHENGVLFHSDTVQSTGKIPFTVDDLGVDFLSISAHKLYGPKGVGLLYVRNGAQMVPFMEGGSQERKRRGGTLNVPGIIGLAKAIELAYEEMDQNRGHISSLQKYFYNNLKEKFPGLVTFNSDSDLGLYNIINISFELEGNKALDGEMLLLNLDIDGICCSNGSACTSGAIEPSHVLTGIGRDEKTAKSSVRFSLGKDNTKEEIDFTLESLEKILDRMLKTV